jgi:hypothetical protein
MPMNVIITCCHNLQFPSTCSVSRKPMCTREPADFCASSTMTRLARIWICRELNIFHLGKRIGDGFVGRSGRKNNHITPMPTVRTPSTRKSHCHPAIPPRPAGGKIPEAMTPESAVAPRYQHLLTDGYTQVADIESCSILVTLVPC